MVREGNLELCRPILKKKKNFIGILYLNLYEERVVTINVLQIFYLFLK